MNTPLVSVVIPAYNHGRYILEAVHSVLRQSLSDLELIVVDDGSTDDTLDRLRTIRDPRVQVVAQRNQGAHSALNRGLGLARGTYLAILNSDDRYTPDRLERLVSVLEHDPEIGLAASYIRVIDAHGAPMGIKHGYRDLEPWPLRAPEQSFRAGDDLHAALLTENYLATTSNFVFPRARYEEVGPFRPLRFTHDWDFALRIAQVADLHLEPVPLLDYRVHDANTIHQDRTTMIFEICWCLAVHLPRHLRDRSEPSASIPPEQVTKLLNSIYTFETEPLLAVMLLLDLANRPELASALVETENGTRRAMLDYIRSRVGHPSDTTSLSTPGRYRHLLSTLRRQVSTSFLRKRP